MYINKLRHIQILAISLGTDYYIKNYDLIVGVAVKKKLKIDFFPHAF